VKHRGKLRRHDPETRAQLAFRFRAMYRNLGWDRATCAKNLHVTQRTLHNWESGKNDIPYAAYRLLRLLNRMELPGPSWDGWCFVGGVLYTPEGRPITGKDGSWWSLLVRQAAMFLELAGAADRDSRRRHGLQDAPASGLVSVSTTCTNFGEEKQHIDSIMQPSWHQPSDSPPNSTPKPASVASGLASVSTPLYASPSTPTCAIRLSWQQGQHPPQTPGWLGQVRQPQASPLPPQPLPPNSAARNAANSKPSSGLAPAESQYRQIAGGAR
jgi:DNA-binding XRE family transcriptional regulator